MVDDVRPFLVQAQDNNGLWNWEGTSAALIFSSTIAPSMSKIGHAR